MDKVTPNRLSILQILIIIIVAGLLFFTKNNPSRKHERSSENITISNSRPCLQKGNSLENVNHFASQDDQFICAEINSSFYPIRLTLIIQKEEVVYSPTYTDAKEFTEEGILFHITPPLPAGKYKVRILYARDTLSEIFLEVKE